MSTNAEIIERLTRIEALLTHSVGRTIPDRPMSLAEVATITGKSVKTVRRWVRRGQLRAKHEGRTWFVLPGHLRRFLAPQEASN